SEFTAVFTNKTIVTPVRGAGRQHGVFLIERLLDSAAKDLGITRAEIRRKTLLRPDQFPFNNEILFQDSAPLTYDSGDYEPALAAALNAIDYRRFVHEEQPRLRAAGRHVGIGVVCYVEGTGIGPYEGARVTVEPSGRVRLATGVGTQGQGHFTVFAQIVAEVLGVDVTDVHVITGDTREFHWGTGTFASRGAVVAGSACHAAAVAVREKVLELASRELGAAPADLVLDGGRVHLRSDSGRGVALGALALKANPLRGARHRQCVLRAARVRRGRAAAQRLVHGLPAPHGDRRAQRGDDSPRNALTAQPGRYEGCGRSRRDPHRRPVRPGRRGRARRLG